MARRAAPVTKGRTPPKKQAETAGRAPTRRGAKAKPQDESPAEMQEELSMPEPMLADAEPAPEPEAPSSPKPRRGRKAKSDAVATDLDAATDAPSPVEPEPEPPAPEPELPELQVEAPKPPPPSPRKTRRNREPEASAPPPLDLPDESPTEGPSAAAAEWHAESGTVTFDWPAIEQVATTEGPNQPMAKLLLAARAEGARSRWPF